MSDYESSAVNRRKVQRRKQLAVGVVGLGAVLGAGAYVVTAQIIDHRNSTVTTDAAGPTVTSTGEADAFVPETPSPSASPAASAVVATKSAVKHSISPAASASMPMLPADEIRAAREAAERAGAPVQPALTAAGEEPSLVTEREERLPNGTLRIITARFDLTGHRELLWAANGGRPVGDAECTQDLHFSENAKPARQPNLLLCWRTSATKSVATILVDHGGHPSTATSVKVIDREWASLG
ncbi:hypothetical protein BJ973_009273 [Actinoplanes tereljensis]|uniref:Uncharacterized protein n=1 Tax=Paractinoplanes tereljensis TaxID=571912 RepID=A0A919NGX2_9ACTN|nr:hypothetical protein [Actinoplanes tereljensis]GIF17762.1 hypothetical protein Ate02nite_04920 [Actinoplanes tereljensis]